MDFAPGLKQTICALFEGHEDSGSVQRIVTPLEYPFKDRVAEVVAEIANALNLPYRSNVELTMAGSMVADHVIDHATPLIVIAASSATRLLEAEVIHMQYLHSHQPGFVLAIAESEQAVGKKQFKRANFYTGKTVDFSPPDLKQLLRQQLH